MFLGGTESEKKNMCLFEDILRYFSQPSKEIEQDQEPKNEHLLASYMAVGWYLNEQQEKQTLNITAKKVIWDNEMYFVIAIKEISQIIVNERLQEIDQYKDQLLASVTHELKTPLNGILSIVEMAEQEKEILVIRGQLELIKKSGKMLEIILNDILDYSRLQKQKLRLIITKFDIEKTVDEVINLVQIQFSKPEIEIKKNIEIENTLIQSDSNRLKQIIFNLLTNAVKFTQKGSISVSISQSSQADCLSITVSDTGVGIPVSLQKKLFQLYGTFDHSKGSNRHGVGLGLVITKNLVQLLGPSDQITLKTSVGEGSSFTFDIFMELTLDENSQLEMENVDEQEDINNPNNINNNNTLQTNAFISCFNNINNSIHLGSPRIKAQLNELQNSTARNINNNIFNSRQATQVFDTDFALEQSPTVKNPYADILIENTSLSFGGAKSPFYVQPEKKHFRLRLGSLRLPQQIAQIPPFFPYPNKKNQRKSTLVSLERTPSPYHIDMSASCIISNTHQQIFPQNSQIFNPHATSNNYSYFHQLNNNNTVNLCTNTCINTNIPSSNQILLPKNLSNTIKNAPSSPEMRPPSFSYNPSTPPLKPYRGTSKMSTVASTYFQTGAQTVSELQCNLPNKQNSYESCSSPIIQFIPSKSNEIEDFSIAEPKQVKNGTAQVLESIFKTQKRILIVDDTYINITVLKMMLGKNPNLIIEEAFNGQQAIDKIVEFNQRNEPFNLVFMDVNMPVMDGLQAIEIIRQKIQDKEIPDLKIAVCSAFDDLQSRMKCLSVGADIHISKPINKSVMEQQLLQLFNDHQILN